MIYRATELIAAEFAKYNIPHTTLESENISIVETGMSLTCGPAVKVLICSQDDTNGVGFRVIGLMQDVVRGKTRGCFGSLQQGKPRAEIPEVLP